MCTANEIRYVNTDRERVANMTNGAAGLGEPVDVREPNWRAYDPLVIEKDRAAAFQPGTKVRYRDLDGEVIDWFGMPSWDGGPLGIEEKKIPWWSIPVVFDADYGHINFINYKALTIVQLPPLEAEVVAVEAAMFEESRVFLDELTGKIWAHTVHDDTRFYCLNDSFTWPIGGDAPGHWTQLYKKVS